MFAVGLLLRRGLEAATAAVAEELPDVVAAFDHVVPRVLRESNLAVLRRYYVLADAAIHTLLGAPATGIPPSDSKASSDEPTAARSEMVSHFMQRDIPAYPWLAPTPNGIGVLTVMVDRLRGYAGGIPNECVMTRGDIDKHQFDWTRKAFASIELERGHSAPLQRAMAIFDLTSSDVADMMGVRRQAVDKWLVAGPPADRMEKIGALAEIADILHYRLVAGAPPIVVRSESEAYGNRSMLEVFAADDQTWLLNDVRQSFDFSDVA